MIAGIRTRVAQVVDDALAPVDPTAVVRPYGTNLDAVEAPTVLVIVDSVEPPSVACTTDVVHLDVLVIGYAREAGPADDQLDTLFDVVAPALDSLPSALRGRAERVTYLDTWPCYRIPVEVRT